MSTDEKQSLERSTWLWWHDLQERRRGDRAALRRCATTTEIMLHPAFHRLVQNVDDRQRLEQLACAVGVLVHVETDGGGDSFARTMAEPKGEKATVSGLRFRRVLRADSPDEVLGELRRAVQLTGRTAPVSALARDLSRWNDDVRKRWAFAYYENAPEKEV
jgi:CRISPR system Cascade subunit CasB